MRTKIVGICGPSGSGKTTLANMLAKDVGAIVISLDNYFLLDPPYKKYKENGKNWELPENIDWVACRELISLLKAGKNAMLRKINWDTLTFSESEVGPFYSLIIIEGFLLLHDEELRNLLDLSVYVHVPDSVGLKRRMEREQTEENKKWYEEVTFPEYASRRALFEELADLVIDGEKGLAENYEIVKNKIQEIE